MRISSFQKFLFHFVRKKSLKPAYKNGCYIVHDFSPNPHLYQPDLYLGWLFQEGVPTNK
jgi:hypothetical protein